MGTALTLSLLELVSRGIAFLAMFTEISHWQGMFTNKGLALF